jgi:hypothetical protein
MVVYAGKVTLGGNIYLKVVYRAVIEVFEDYFVFLAFEILCYYRELGTPITG